MKLRTYLYVIQVTGSSSRVLLANEELLKAVAAGLAN